MKHRGLLILSWENVSLTYVYVMGEILGFVKLLGKWRGRYFTSLIRLCLLICSLPYEFKIELLDTEKKERHLRSGIRGSGTGLIERCWVYGREEPTAVFRGSLGGLSIWQLDLVGVIAIKCSLFLCDSHLIGCCNVQHFFVIVKCSWCDTRVLGIGQHKLLPIGLLWAGRECWDFQKKYQGISWR